MKAACPSCGAEVEFRYDDSFVRVCGHCRAAVVRADRSIESLGRVADLVPLSSPLHLFIEGRFQGLGFMLVGRAQIRHGAGGVWQEWYGKFDDGRWGWIAEAQGRVVLTFEAAGAGPVPPWEALAPGHQIGLFDGGWRTFTLAERGEAVYLSAEGEIPYRFTPGTSFRFADLADGAGRFATLDYGQGAPVPTTYLGHETTYGELGLVGAGAALPAAVDASARPIASRHLACPQCGGSIDLRMPELSIRVMCAYCGAFLDVADGDLRLLPNAGLHRGKPGIALGSKGTFFGRTFTVVGYIERHALIGGERYPFHEYLLHDPAIGFRWLVDSDGHWSFVRPLAVGAVAEVGMSRVQYQGVVFRRFQHCAVEVSAVLGELYWRLEAGERVDATDWIAPPAMISREVGTDEVTWSLGEYLAPAEVARALGLDKLPSSPVGIAPNQPFRQHRAPAYFGMLTLAALATAAVLGILADNRLVRQESFTVADPGLLAPVAVETAPGQDGQEGAVPPAGQVFFTSPFELAAGQNVEIDLTAFFENSWMVIAGDLVNEDTGEIQAFDQSIEYYRGYDGGESWSEGSTRAAVHIGAVPAGRYVVRLDVQRDPKPTRGSAVNLAVDVRQDVFRVGHLVLVLLAIGIPGLLFLLWHWMFERRRWRDSEEAPWHLRPGGDDE